MSLASARRLTYPLTRPHRISFGDNHTWGAGFPSEFGTNYSSGRIVFTLPGNWSDVGCGAPTTPPTPSGEGCSDGARVAATVGGLALLLQVIVLMVNWD